MRIAWHAPGPDQHGVVRHGRTIAQRLAGAGHDVHLWPTTAEVTHVQFTDALFGPDIASAAQAFGQWRPRGPVVATVHDLPSGEGARADRRRAGYREVLRRVDVVIVSSEHERRLAQELGDVPVFVVPLPLPALLPPDPQKPPWADRPTIGVLGFVYPGKGHELALQLAADRDLQVVALGDVSPGHDDLRRDGVLITGPLTDAQLHRAALEITVPLSHNPGVSASASLMTWIAAGRRPLVDDGPYASEIAARWPQAVTRLDETALDKALADPTSTWCEPPADNNVVEGHLAAFLRAVA